MSENNTPEPIQTWAVVELMGHVKTAGRVSEEAHFGTVLLRLDIPAVNHIPEHTEYYGGASIYRITPCTEEAARLVLERVQTMPAVPFMLPRPEFGQREMFVEDDDDDVSDRDADEAPDDYDEDEG